MTRAISASACSAQCSAVLDEVAGFGEEVVVAKHGRPAARIVAAVEPPTLRGSARFNVSDDELAEPAPTAAVARGRPVTKDERIRSFAPDETVR